MSPKVAVVSGYDVLLIDDIGFGDVHICNRLELVPSWLPFREEEEEDDDDADDDDEELDGFISLIAF